MAEILKPGEHAETSGQYELVGPRGGAVPGSTETTAVAGKPMPPTRKPGQGWQIVDPTRHKK